MVVPSHFEPLANPGMLKLGLKMMLSPASPLAISPLAPDLAKWLKRFVASANHAHVEANSRLILGMNLQSRDLYRQLLGDNLGTTGMLMICKTESAFGGEQKLAETAQKLGLGTEELSRFDLASLGYDAAGAIKYSDDAFLTPPDFLTKLREESKIVEASVTAITQDAVKTSEGDIEGEFFVLAGGAWSGGLAPKLLMTPGRGYGFTVENPPGLTEHCAILVEARIATTPMTNGQRFTGGMELGNYSDSPDRRRLQRIRNAIPDYIPAYKNHAFNEEIWVGHRPCSPDGIPYIGPFAHQANLYAATGHGMMGMSLAPITGKLISEMICGEPPSLDVSKCSPNRIR